MVIQKQIASMVSGVGFSLNPLNNCYDEAVINANTGLGESVVSGMITPDKFIVDKPNRSIMERKIGTKEQSIVLEEGGGTKVVDGPKDKPALQDAQVLELADLLIKVEAFYDRPMDIEWAYDEESLYLDGSITKQGMTRPISVLGCDLLGITQKSLIQNMMGIDACADVQGGVIATLGGRMYKNLSTDNKLMEL